MNARLPGTRNARPLDGTRHDKQWSCEKTASAEAIAKRVTPQEHTAAAEEVAADRHQDERQ